jgi:post-segregation antitoxin (ccd killing protein)
MRAPSRQFALMRARRVASSRIMCLLQERLDTMNIERLVQDAIRAEIERVFGHLWRAERGHHHHRALRAQPPDVLEQPEVV